VLTGVQPGMRSFREEVFGPVASIVPFGSDDEAVALANDNEYGLSAGVFSASVGRAMAIGNRLRTGLLHSTTRPSPTNLTFRSAGPASPETARASAGRPTGRSSPTGSG
jgi:acyl-CoA reductase-like NAD-dependent aldehyde dehydrogenase